MHAAHADEQNRIFRLVNQRLTLENAGQNHITFRAKTAQSNPIQINSLQQLFVPCFFVHTALGEMMANTLLTMDEAVKTFGDSVKAAGLSPAELMMLAYQMQTTMGSFPRCEETEKKLAEKINAERKRLTVGKGE